VSPEAGPIPAPPPIFIPGNLAPVTGGSPIKPPSETGDGVIIGSDEIGPIAAPVLDQPDAPFAISSPNSTADLLKVLSEVTTYGMPLKKALLQVAAPFPVAGPAWWIDDWHAPRSGGRLHQGLDIFAPRGTPLVAATDGVVTQKYVGDLPGISVEITGEQGVQYFYAHLEAWHEGLELGQDVKKGQVIGYVGNTGNAISTPPHLHFEYQPLGIPEPPKPRVDRWIAQAEQRALALLQELSGTPTAASGFRLTRLFDLAGEGGQNGPAQLVPLAGSQPGLSSLEVANPTLGQMAWEIDWGEQADEQLTELVEEYRRYVVEQALVGLAPWPFEEAAGSMDTQAGGDGSD
jgi:murein DD-endopeptidase MepM/ murein hydrolase activator NlpD